MLAELQLVHMVWMCTPYAPCSVAAAGTAKTSLNGGAEAAEGACGSVGAGVAPGDCGSVGAGVAVEPEEDVGAGTAWAAVADAGAVGAASFDLGAPCAPVADAGGVGLAGAPSARTVAEAEAMTSQPARRTALRFIEESGLRLRRPRRRSAGAPPESLFAPLGPGLRPETRIHRLVEPADEVPDDPVAVDVVVRRESVAGRAVELGE